MRIDPWSSQQYADYSRLRDAFGITPFTQAADLPDPHPLLERGVVFGQRDFDRVARAVHRHDPWALLTGLMPSGNMHLGHKMLLDQIVYYQGVGAEVFIAVADIEAYATRGLSLAKCRQLAVDQYVRNYLALGLQDSAQIYFQSQRASVKDLAWKLGRKTNWSTMEAIYGFGSGTNMGHVQAPLVQVGDILHVQLPEHGGPRPTLVPVGVDQDPHLRLTRDIADAFRVFSIKREERGLGVYLKPEPTALVAMAADIQERTGNPVLKQGLAKSLMKADNDLRAASIAKDLLKLAKWQLGQQGFGEFSENFAYRALYLPAASGDDVPVVDAALAALEQAALGEPGFLRPSSTYHRFMSGLTGSKMSSSKPETAVFLTDTPETAEKRVKEAVTGGRATAEEQRRLGGEWDKCPVAELYVYHLAPDTKDLAQRHEECTSGAILCGPCKGIAADRAVVWLKGHREKRDAVTDEQVQAVVRED